MKRTILLLVAGVLLVSGSQAWDAYGHRTITQLALAALPADAPAWLKAPDVQDRIVFQANEPDRWRGWHSDALAHMSHPNHYLDIEQLEQFGLTLETIPHLRREYLRAMAISKHLHPEMVDPYDASKDSARVYEWPGFVLHAIAENYGALQAEFNEIQILEKLNDPKRKAQLEQARCNAIYHMGMLSHFVGDLAQPLHTTIHHHGWVGDNPNNYTTDRGIHHKIDAAPRDMGITVKAVQPMVKPAREVNADDPWDDVVGELTRAHDKVETVYQLEADGKLDGPEGKKLIAERVADGAEMLSALYWAAWKSSTPTEKQIKDWVRYNDFDAAKEIQAAASAGD